MSLFGRNISNVLNSIGISNNISVKDYSNIRFGLSEVNKSKQDKVLGI